jgi:hypothetical protein
MVLRLFGLPMTMNLFRKNSLRPWIVVVLIALLCAGLFLFGGNAPAPVVAVFVLIAWLLAVACRFRPHKALTVTDPAIDQTPSRAPPSFSF